VASTPTDRLRTTIDAVREVMVKRLEEHSLAAEAEREIQLALEEIEVMWDELLGQAEALTRENERYAEFFEYAPDAYVVTDAGGNVREANEAAAELFGVSKRELLDRTLSEFVAEDDRVKFLSSFVGALVNPQERPQSWNSRVRGTSGSECPVTMSVRGIPLKRSGVRGLCWLIRLL
jgi:PAS domain S-box-containing protein